MASTVFTTESLIAYNAAQNDAQRALLDARPTCRAELLDAYADAALDLIDAGYGRHSVEWVALSRAVDVVENIVPAVSLRKPVSLRKRRIPTVDVALRSGLPVGMPVTGAPICRDDNGREILF